MQLHPCQLENYRLGQKSNLNGKRRSLSRHVSVGYFRRTMRQQPDKLANCPLSTD